MPKLTFTINMPKLTFTINIPKLTYNLLIKPLKLFYNNIAYIKN